MLVIRSLFPKARGDWGKVGWELGLAGVFLGLHFWAFMQSLWMTSIASSVFFATTTPLWVALLAPVVASEPWMRARGWLGMAVALGGGLVIASAAGAGAVTIPGILVATLSAWFISGYLLLGRRVRGGMGVLEFGAATSGVGSLLLFACALALGEPLSGYGLSTVLAFFALAAIPQLIGHNALVWALRYAGAAVVSLAVLLEPAGASMLGWLVFGEAPVTAEIIGGLVLFVGLALIVRDPQQNTVSRETSAG